MSLAYIRKTYHVPAKRGGQVSVTTRIFGTPKTIVGTIIGSCYAHLKVRQNDRPGVVHIVHPKEDTLRYFLSEEQATKEKKP